LATLGEKLVDLGLSLSGCRVGIEPEREGDRQLPNERDAHMLRRLKELERYKVSATDGDVGRVVDFLLDDAHWIARYLVVETLGTLDGRQVLITPISFRQFDWSTKQFYLALTRDKIKNSPNIDVDKPVPSRRELDYYGYYGYPCYWGSSGFWGVSAYPGLLADGSWIKANADHERKFGDVHLRSAIELRGYHIQGRDEPIGHVEDFIVDDVTWEVRYLVIDTSNWWFGKRVLIRPHWVTRVSGQERNVYVGMNRQAIRNSPEWSSTEAIGREHEASRRKHYGRKAYRDDGERRVWVPPPTQQHTE
jgi:PRC-barrel domain